MLDESSRSAEHFNRLLHMAYRDFLESELRHNVMDHGPAVRAAQFNEYVNQHYPILRKIVSPDICESYMQKLHYLVAPVDQEPDMSLDNEKRFALACSAYKEFKEDIKFKGTEKAEVVAFQHYVAMKYPKSLPGFSEEEAEDVQAIGVGCNINPVKIASKALLGIICATTLAFSLSAFMSASDESKELDSPTKDNYSQNGGQDFVPQDPYYNIAPNTIPSPYDGPSIGPAPSTKEQEAEWKRYYESLHSQKREDYTTGPKRE